MLGIKNLILLNINLIQFIMKKIILICLLIVGMQQVMCPQNNQPTATSSEGFIYSEIVGTSQLFSSKVSVQIDFGQKKNFWVSNNFLRDEKGNVIKFNSMVDAMNYMGTLGWEFAQAYAITVSNQNVYHFLLKKKASKEDLDKLTKLTTEPSED